jgi:hypothetical protein
LSKADFKSPYTVAVLQQAAQQRFADIEAVKPLAADYLQATQDWRVGDFERAKATMRVLADSDWDSGARRTLLRYETLHQELLLLTQGDSPDYAQRLISFYAKLDQQEDAFIWQTLAGEFEKYEEQINSEAAKRQQLAEESWQSYREAGGISGALRLENKVSETFGTRAELLREAYAKISQARQIFALSDGRLSEETATLLQSISNEVKQQQLSLNELKRLLDADVISQKIALLPVLAEREI